MKPVAVFRHAKTEGPGYFSTFLDQHQIPWRLFKIDEGDKLPTSATEFSGLVFMGGPMSVNDDLPWIPEVLALIHEAIQADIPVLGHCLGGQLISKALGAVVSRNPVKEIGWGDVAVVDNDVAKAWFGDVSGFLSFHWHGETFALPAQATHILASQFCKNQAYAIGKHLAFQCHIEMTAEMIGTWCENGADEVHASITSPGVQSLDEIQSQLDKRVSALNSIAAKVYSQWIKGLKH